MATKPNNKILTQLRQDHLLVPRIKFNKCKWHNPVKEKINNSQDDISPIETNNPTTTGFKNSRIDDAQENDCDTIFMNVIEVFKRQINKSHEEIHENTHKNYQWI